jgi:uncharacterized delta-60 repeat protein
MKEKLLRVALPILCLGLVQCTSNTGTTSGAPTALATLRLNPTTGIADSGFGGAGIVVTRIDPTLFGFAMAVVVQPLDSRIVVGGSNGLAGAGQIALVRYNTDGSLDTTGFGTTGTGGIVKTPLALPAFATAIAIQPADNKIVVAALAFEATTNGAGNTSIVLLRYKTDGTLDATFGTSGVAAPAAIGSGFAGDGCALLLQGSGNIVVAGSSQDGNLVLYRYTSAGVLDATFGAPTPTGKTVTPLAPSVSFPFDRSPAMAAQSDGRIIVATRNGDDQAVLRYSVDGVLDTAFGPSGANGIVVTDIAGTLNYANAVAIQSAGMGVPGNLDMIVVVGHAALSDVTSDISLVRYSKDGVPDATFGSGGIVTTDINGQFDNAFSVALQDLGGEPRILVAGNTGFNGASQTVVLRYNPDGTADKSFGSAQIGLVRVPLVGPSTIASGNAIAVQPLGIVVTGYD